MASADEINSTLKGIVVNLAGEVAAMNAVATAMLSVGTAILSTFPQTRGTFTLANATVTVVTQPATKANSFVSFTPTNATGALTLRTQGLFLSALTAGVSFSLSTQSNSALGTETFSYAVF